MKESAIAWLALAIIIGGGIFIRTSAIAEPVWLDECHTAWAVDTDSPTVVASRAADGNQPPLYFEIVWAVTQVLGLSEFSLRFVSLFAGSMLMVVAAFWAKQLTQRWSAAVLVAGLIAFDGQFIFYASEARSYSLVQLIGLVQAIFFWSLINQSKEESRVLSWTAWTLFSIALLYTHYTSLWILIAEFITFLIVAVMRRKLSLQLLIAAITIVAAMLSGWLSASKVFDRRSNWDSVSSIETLWTDIEPWLVHWILIPIGFAIAGWLASFIWPTQTEETETQTSSWLLWSWIALWALLGPIGIATADWLEVAPMALVRYSAVCWVAFAIFASLSLTQFSPVKSWAIAAIILASSFFGNWWVHDTMVARALIPFRSEDWVTTVHSLADANSDEPIFQFGDVIEDIDAPTTRDDQRFQRYLLFPILGADAIRGSDDLSTNQPIIPMSTWNPQFTNEQLNLVRIAKGCWLLVRGDREYALIIPGELERYIGQPIEFKMITNERMPLSQVHLMRVRLSAKEPKMPTER